MNRFDTVLAWLAREVRPIRFVIKVQTDSPDFGEYYKVSSLLISWFKFRLLHRCTSRNQESNSICSSLIFMCDTVTITVLRLWLQQDRDQHFCKTQVKFNNSGPVIISEPSLHLDRRKPGSFPGVALEKRKKTTTESVRNCSIGDSWIRGLSNHLLHRASVSGFRWFWDRIKVHQWLWS